MLRKTNAVGYCLYVESKKYNKLVNITRKRRRLTDAENKRGYQWGGLGGEIQGGERRYKLACVRQAQGCIVQHGEYGHYFVICSNIQPTFIINGK